MTSDAGGLTAAAKRADNAVATLNNGFNGIDKLLKRLEDSQNFLIRYYPNYQKPSLRFHQPLAINYRQRWPCFLKRTSQVLDITKQLSSDQKTLSNDVAAITKSAQDLASADEKIKSVNSTLASNQKASAEIIAKIEGNAVGLKASIDTFSAQQKNFADAVAKIELISSGVEKLPNDLSLKDVLVQAVNNLNTASLDVKTAN